MLKQLLSILDKDMFGQLLDSLEKQMDRLNNFWRCWITFGQFWEVFGRFEHLLNMLDNL